MTTTHTIQMLTRYNAWANKAIFAAVAELPSGEATKERPTLFKNMVNTLNHLHIVDVSSGVGGCGAVRAACAFCHRIGGGRVILLNCADRQAAGSSKSQSHVSKVTALQTEETV